MCSISHSGAGSGGGRAGVILPSFRVNPEKAMTAAKALPVSIQKIENILSTTDESLDEVFSLNGFKNL